MVCLFAGGFAPFSTPVELHHTAIHYEHRKPSTVSASPAVIRIASKHLHNDLARAIEALEQKTNACCFYSLAARVSWICDTWQHIHLPTCGSIPH